MVQPRDSVSLEQRRRSDEYARTHPNRKGPLAIIKIPGILNVTAHGYMDHESAELHRVMALETVEHCAGALLVALALGTESAKTAAREQLASALKAVPK